MKKKLAIVTLAVGFFTLCNLVLYTRNLRAEEMTRFWHWSAEVQQPLASNSSNAFAQQQQFNDSNPWGGNVVAMMSEGVQTSAGPTPTQTSVSSSCWRAHFILDNRTHVAGNVNGCCIAVDVTLHSSNRTIRVTYNASMFRQHNISIWDEDTSADQVTMRVTMPVLTPMVTPSTVINSSKSYQLSSVPLKNGTALTALNKHHFGYLINIEDLCEDQRNTSGLALVILVTTAVNHFAHRKAIRDTWGGFAKNRSDVRLAFVMGQPTDPAIQSVILHESLQFADIVQEDFSDTYRNLSLKTVMLLKWAHTFCPKARFIMKSDDDMFINVPNLLKYIGSLRSDKRQLFGRLVRGAKPVRSKSSKYYAPTSEYKEKVYPDYLSGTAYVMSADVAPKLFSTSQSTAIFFLEDVYVTGICAKKAGIVRRNHPGFVFYKRAVKGCAYYKVISGHNNSPNDVRKIWKDLQKKNLKCP